MTDSTTPAHSNQPLLYETKIGLIFKRTLTITQEGVLWKGRLVRFNEIVSTGWGGTRHSYNGIPTGTVYEIQLDDRQKRMPMRIKTRREAVYDVIVNLIQQYAGIDILTRLLKGLQAGERYIVGSSVVCDDGIHIARKTLFKDPEMLYSPWQYVSLTRQQGLLIIGGANGGTEQLSYKENNNTHIIDYAITMAHKHELERLSDLLQPNS